MSQRFWSLPWQVIPTESMLPNDYQFLSEKENEAKNSMNEKNETSGNQININDSQEKITRNKLYDKEKRKKKKMMKMYVKQKMYKKKKFYLLLIRLKKLN